MHLYWGAEVSDPKQKLSQVLQCSVNIFFFLLCVCVCACMPVECNLTVYWRYVLVHMGTWWQTCGMLVAYHADLGLIQVLVLK